MRWRIAVSAAIGFVSGPLCWFLMKHFHQDAADFRWALHLTHRLLAKQNPYDTPLEQYPLTAGLLALPFVRLQPELAAGLFWGISSSLMVFGLTRHGYTRLLIFFAYPYWAVILTVQWSPIIAASALFFPLLLPATMAKPQVGLPVFLTRLSRLGLLACVAVALVSLAAMPNWRCFGIGNWATMSTSSRSSFFRDRFFCCHSSGIAIAMHSFFLIRRHAAALVF